MDTAGIGAEEEGDGEGARTVEGGFGSVAGGGGRGGGGGKCRGGGGGGGVAGAGANVAAIGTEGDEAVAEAGGADAVAPLFGGVLGAFPELFLLHAIRSSRRH